EILEPLPRHLGPLRVEFDAGEPHAEPERASRRHALAAARVEDERARAGDARQDVLGHRDAGHPGRVAVRAWPRVPEHVRAFRVAIQAAPTRALLEPTARHGVGEL